MAPRIYRYIQEHPGCTLREAKAANGYRQSNNAILEDALDSIGPVMIYEDRYWVGWDAWEAWEDE